MNRIIQFVKNWTLVLSIVFGVCLYYALADIDALADVKEGCKTIVPYLIPTLLFIMLTITFCKVKVRDMRPHLWQLWLILWQIAWGGGIALFLIFNPESAQRVTLEAVMALAITPCATASAVVTLKLGGNAATNTSYILISSLIAAIFAPLVFPLIENHAGLPFGEGCLVIMRRIFPILLLPFVTACLLRKFFPALHRRILRLGELSFQLWSFSLIIITGQTLHSLHQSGGSATIVISMCLICGAFCAMQFFVGKQIGTPYGERISAGQSLGQKNVVLSSWMAYTWLDPMASVGTGCCIIWQNIINSYQLWKNRKKKEKSFSK